MTVKKQKQRNTENKKKKQTYICIDFYFGGIQNAAYNNTQECIFLAKTNIWVKYILFLEATGKSPYGNFSGEIILDKYLPHFRFKKCM